MACQPFLQRLQDDGKAGITHKLRDDKRLIPKTLRQAQPECDVGKASVRFACGEVRGRSKLEQQNDSFPPGYQMRQKNAPWGIRIVKDRPARQPPMVSL